MLNLGPCSMLPPHLHPRAANYVVAVHGNTTTYMYEENGARLVTQELTPGHGTIFPQGSMHMMMNTGMSPLSSFLGLGPHRWRKHRAKEPPREPSMGLYTPYIATSKHTKKPPFHRRENKSPVHTASN